MSYNIVGKRCTSHSDSRCTSHSDCAPSSACSLLTSLEDVSFGSLAQCSLCSVQPVCLMGKSPQSGTCTCLTTGDMELDRCGDGAGTTVMPHSSRLCGFARESGSYFAWEELALALCANVCACFPTGVLINSTLCVVASPFELGLGSVQALADAPWVLELACTFLECPLHGCYLQQAFPRVCAACPEGLFGRNGLWWRAQGPDARAGRLRLPAPDRDGARRILRVPPRLRGRGRGRLSKEESCEKGTDRILMRAALNAALAENSGHKPQPVDLFRPQQANCAESGLSISTSMITSISTVYCNLPKH
jgi:hypothetical protein